MLICPLVPFTSIYFATLLSSAIRELFLESSVPYLTYEFLFYELRHSSSIRGFLSLARLELGFAFSSRRWQRSTTILHLKLFCFLFALLL